MGLNDDFLDKVGRAGAEAPQVSSQGETDSDKSYGAAMKKHRLFIKRLDHLYETVTHPASIGIVVGAITAVFLATRYIAVTTGNELASAISSDFGTVLAYAAAVVATHVITKLVEGRKK